MASNQADSEAASLSVIARQRANGEYISSRYNRMACIAFMRRFGVFVRLPEACLSTAATLFHHYTVACDMTTTSRRDLILMVTATLFLAAKVEESPKKLREIIVALDHFVHGPPVPHRQGPGMPQTHHPGRLDADGQELPDHPLPPVPHRQHRRHRHLRLRPAPQPRAASLETGPCPRAMVARIRRLSRRHQRHSPAAV